MARPDTYTDEEKEFLIQNYSSMPWGQLIEGINRIGTCKKSKSGIRSKACLLGLKRSGTANSTYTAEEDQMVKDTYASSDEGDLEHNILQLIRERMPHRTLRSVYARANSLGLRIRKQWTDDDIAFLKDNYYTMFSEELAEVLGRTPEAIYNMVRKLGLRGAPRSLYSADDIQFVIDNYEKMSDDEIGFVLHRAGHSIKELRRKLGKRKPRPENVFYSIQPYTHRHNETWKRASAAACGYKCVVTGEPFDAIHHLYSRNMIIEEMLYEHPEYKNVNFNDLSDSEKETAISHFIDVQSRYPLGVCLKGEIHILFHQLYGYGDNTPEQFFEFIKTIAPDRLDEILKIVNM